MNKRMKQFRTRTKAQLDDARKKLPRLRSLIKQDLRKGSVSYDTEICVQYDLLLKVRRVLDQAMNQFFEKCYLPKLAGNRPNVYFPIARNEERFQKRLKDSKLNKLKEDYPKVYSFLKSIQPYANDDYSWLQDLSDRANETHVGLTPQDQIRTGVQVSNNQGASTSWTKGVSFSGNVSVLNVPIDPETQLPQPHPSIKINVEGYLVFEGTNINVLELCELSVEEGEKIVEMMLEFIETNVLH